MSAGLAAILAAHFVCSRQLMGADENCSLEYLNSSHGERVQPKVKACKGRIVS